MVLWFLATAVLAVLFVFDSPAVDYRFVAVGALGPLLETATGKPWVLHTLLGSVALLVIVMAGTVGRRIRRRRLLGVPVGAFLFLVFSATWTRPDLFWWPVAGFDELGQGRAPELDRPLGVLVGLEVIGALALGWLWRTRGLASAPVRARLLATGRLPGRTERA